MHIGAHLLQPLLVRHAETLFFINDNKAELLELHLLAEDGMGAHHHIYRALGQPGAGGAGFLLGHQPRQAADIQREAGETFGEAVEMLAGEQGGGGNHRYLHSRHRRHEGRPQRHLGLAETDVAADQPVHRFAAGEIVQYVGDGRVLILGFLPGEAIDERRETGGIGQQHRRRAQGALGGRFEQLVGDLADALLQLGAAFLPPFAAEFIEPHALALAAEAAEDIQVFHRDVELVAASIGQHHAIMRAVADGNALQPLVAADAVVHVDDEIAGRQRRELSHEGVGRFLALLAAHQPVAQQILLGDQLDVATGKAGFQRQHQRGDAAAPVWTGAGYPQRLLPIARHCRGRGGGLAEDRDDTFAAAGGIAGEDRLAARAGGGGEVFGRRLIDIVAPGPFRREIAGAGEGEIKDAGAFRLGENFGAVDRPFGQRRVDLGAREVERLGG